MPKVVQPVVPNGSSFPSSAKPITTLARTAASITTINSTTPTNAASLKNGQHVIASTSTTTKSTTENGIITTIHIMNNNNGNSSSSSSPQSTTTATANTLTLSTKTAGTATPPVNPTVKHRIPQDILDDVASRFIINLPTEERNNLIRICFQIELAHWFYLDFYHGDPSATISSIYNSLNIPVPTTSAAITTTTNTAISSANINNGTTATVGSTATNRAPCGMYQFTIALFHHIPFLRVNMPNVDEILANWKKYKVTVPTYGAILMTEDLEHVLLVQSYWAKSSWGFPKGKVNENEPPEHCAVREVYEETGYDITSLLNKVEYTESVMNLQYVRLYLVRGVPYGTQFAPRTRKEIKACEWFPLDKLPNHKNDTISRTTLGINSNAFFMIFPFVKRIKKWVFEQRNKPPQSVGDPNYSMINSAFIPTQTLVSNSNYHSFPTIFNYDDITATQQLQSLLQSQNHENTFKPSVIMPSTQVATGASMLPAFNDIGLYSQVLMHSSLKQIPLNNGEMEQSSNVQSNQMFELNQMLAPLVVTPVKNDNTQVVPSGVLQIQANPLGLLGNQTVMACSNNNNSNRMITVHEQKKSLTKVVSGLEGVLAIAKQQVNELDIQDENTPPPPVRVTPGGIRVLKRGEPASMFVRRQLDVVEELHDPKSSDSNVGVANKLQVEEQQSHPPSDEFQFDVDAILSACDWDVNAEATRSE